MPLENKEAIHATARELVKYLVPVQLEGLRLVAQRIEEGDQVDIGRWNRGAELTTYRAGVVPCGDLEIAERFVARGVAPPDGRRLRRRWQELSQFSLSQDYSILRRALAGGHG